MFDVGDSLQAVTDKLIRRHPHVFQPDGRVHDAESKERAPSADAALERWNTLKAESAHKPAKPRLLGGFPKGLPALLRAFKIGKRAAEVGFDWKHSESSSRRLRRRSPSCGRRWRNRLIRSAEEEMGDLLLAVANLSRKLGIDPEGCASQGERQIHPRFQAMEQAIDTSGRSMRDMNIEELEREWH